MSLTSIHPSNVRSSNNVMNANNTLLNGKSRAYGNLKKRERGEEEKRQREKEKAKSVIWFPYTCTCTYQTLGTSMKYSLVTFCK